MVRYFTRTFVRLAVACMLALFLFLGVFVHFSPQAHAKALNVYDFSASLSGNIKGCSASQEWILNVDQGGYGEYYARSNGGQLCAQAIWAPGNLSNCTWLLWVPSSFADITNIGVGFTYWIGFYTHKVFALNENAYTDQWAVIPTGLLQSVITVDLSNNDGYRGPDPYIGINTDDNLRAVC